MNIRKAIFMLIMLIPFLSKGQDIKGDWHGLLEVQGIQLRIIFHISMENDKLTATLDSPDQSAYGINVEEIKYENGKLSLSMPNLSASYSGSPNQTFDTIEGNFSQMGRDLSLELQRKVIDKPLVVRPQEPKKPYPYDEEEVHFPNDRDNISLAGTLTIPQKNGKYPAVVMISGSGPQDRNEALLHHKPFLVIADHLTRQGISVLRFDDRGVGQSEGDHSMATSADFATDVLAAVSYLKKSPQVDPDNIGLIGHSEGGLIAPMVATQAPDIAFIVLLAGPGVPGDEIIFLQQKLIGEAEGTDKKELKENNKFLRKAFKQMRKSDNFEQIKERLAAKIKKGLIKQGMDAKEVEQISNQTLASIANPWFKFFIDYDPVSSLQEVHCPVLALNGGKDLQVDANQNLPVIKKALAEAGNQDVTIKILPGLNHLFQSSDSGKPSEYGKLEEIFSPMALEEISIWIRAKTK